MTRRTYTGSDVEISYDLKRCIHAEACVKGLPSVFDPNARPWIDADGAPADAVAAAIHACPTGALQYRRLDGGAEEACDETCAVHCEGDGPLYVRGPVRVRVPGQEDVIVESRVAFCRCGQSANKPFCDNAHRDAGFQASGPIDTARAVSADVAAGRVAESGGEVLVTPHENGPFHFEGVVEITGAGHDGSASFLDPWMCRCGGSGNKPFCDGTHKEIGFQAEGP